MHYAVIRSGSGKDVAVIVHDPLTQRCVFKGDADSDLYKAFSVAHSRPVVIPVEHGKAMLRRKVTPAQEDFLRALVSKCVHHPYDVRVVASIEGYRLDAAADKLAKDLEV